MKATYFHLSTGKQICVKAGPRIPRKLKKRIKERNKMNLPKLIREGLNFKMPVIEQSVTVPKDKL